MTKTGTLQGSKDKCLSFRKVPFLMDFPNLYLDIYFTMVFFTEPSFIF